MSEGRLALCIPSAALLRYAFLVGLAVGGDCQFGKPSRCRMRERGCGTYGGRRQSRWRRTADGFAVYGPKSEARDAFCAATLPAQRLNCLTRMPEMAGLIGALGAPVARMAPWSGSTTTPSILRRSSI
jgi:hypothetical protein